jgi:predicted MFS family arabinose efflux permease
MKRLVPNINFGYFRRFDARIWIIAAIGLLNVAGFSLSLPFLSLYLYQERGVPMTVVGTIILISGLCSAVTQIFGGVITDRVGRRPLLISAAMTGALLFVVMAILIAVEAPIWAIVIAYATGQSAMMITRPANQAMITDISPKKQLAEAYGILRVGMNLGWAVGPAIGGHLLVFLPYPWLFGVTALTSLITCGLIFFLVKESFGGTAEKLNVRTIFLAAKDRHLLKFTILSLLVFLVMGQMISTLSVFTVDRLGFTTAQYGMLLTTNGIIVVILQYPVAVFAGRIAKFKALALGALFYALGYLLFGWVGSYTLAIAAMVIITLGEVTFSPVSLSVVGELSPYDRRGRYMAFIGLSEGLGFSTASLLGGALLDSFPTQPPFIWGTIAFIAFVAVVGFLRWGSTSKPALANTRQ